MVTDSPSPESRPCGGSPLLPPSQAEGLRVWGLAPYEEVVQAMQAFTDTRVADTPDELWLVQHPPVYTQGLAGRAEHILDNPQGPHHIPVVQANRGGQVTYHGPGQVVVYPLLDLRRRGYFVKEYVFRLESAILRTLADWGVTGHRVSGAPGVYVRLEDPFGHARLRPPAAGEDALQGLGKIAALGIKVTRHCTYHGLALNVAMDLQPFARINPCGYSGLRTVDLASLGVPADWQSVANGLLRHLQRELQAVAAERGPGPA